MRSNTVCIYSGPSSLDGSPIIVLVSGLVTPSENTATGPLAQVWIMLADTHPVVASRTGADKAVCGECPLRGHYDAAKDRHGVNRACYVALNRAPSVLYNRYRAGLVPEADPAAVARQIRGQALRLGAWGDPAAVPLALWDQLARYTSTVLGYTHSWAICDPGLKRYCMASVDSPEERVQALAAGWRTFRTRTALEPILKGEAICPKSEEAGRKLTCVQCRYCDGQAKGKKGSVVIQAHGPVYATAAYRKLKAAKAL